MDIFGFTTLQCVYALVALVSFGFAVVSLIGAEFGDALDVGGDVDVDADVDADADDAPLGPEDLGMTGAAKGKSKAGHHVTWLIASTSTEAQTLIPEWVLGFCLVFSGWRLRSSHPGSSRRGSGTTGRSTRTGERNASESGATATRCERARGWHRVECA